MINLKSLKNLSVFLFIFISNIGFSQKVDTHSVLFLPLENKNAHPRTVNILENIIRKSLIDDYRITVVDRGKIKTILAELELQRYEDFIDGIVVDQGKAIGAQYILHARYAKRNGVIRLQLTDISTGNMVAEERCNIKNNGYKVLNPSVIKLLNTTLKATEIEIGKVTKSKKGAAKKVLLIGGSTVKLQPKQKFDVFEKYQETINEVDYIRKKKIGEVQIILIEDENFSIAKVVKGKKDIFKKLQTGTKLMIIK